MNLFLPFENDVKSSVECLDNARLNKQILECYQLLTSAIKEKNGEKPNGWYKHPVYVFYRDDIEFLDYYGFICCCEYFFRFHKMHKLANKFGVIYKGKMTSLKDDYYMVNIWATPKFTPYYMEGSKGQPNYIRTTENVSALFQAKLCKKWEQDKAKGLPPKWTNRPVPQFYEKFLKESE